MKNPEPSPAKYKFLLGRSKIRIMVCSWVDLRRIAQARDRFSYIESDYFGSVNSFNINIAIQQVFPVSVRVNENWYIYYVSLQFFRQDHKK
jgi:hypothetical protein